MVARGSSLWQLGSTFAHQFRRPAGIFESLKTGPVTQRGTGVFIPSKKKPNQTHRRGREPALICRGGTPKEMGSYRPVSWLEEGRGQDGNKATKRGDWSYNHLTGTQGNGQADLKVIQIRIKAGNRSQPSQAFNPGQRSPPTRFSPQPYLVQNPESHRPENTSSSACRKGCPTTSQFRTAFRFVL